MGVSSVDSLSKETEASVAEPVGRHVQVAPLPAQVPLVCSTVGVRSTPRSSKSDGARRCRKARLLGGPELQQCRDACEAEGHSFVSLERALIFVQPFLFRSVGGRRAGCEGIAMGTQAQLEPKFRALDVHVAERLFRSLE